MSVIFDGLSLGAIYALIALGYTMVYGIAKMLNFAHGDIIMVGAYAVFTTLAAGGNLAIGVLASVIVCTLMGIIIEKVAYRPLRGVTPIAVLITAIGVSYLLQSIAQLIFGAKAQSVSLPSLGAVSIAGTNVSVSSILTMGISAVIMIALTLFIKKTRTGRAMLAVSEDRGAAQLMGINVNKIITDCGADPRLDARHQGVHRGGYRRHRLHPRRDDRRRAPRRYREDMPCRPRPRTLYHCR